MLEEWLLAAAPDQAHRNRLRHLLDVAPLEAVNVAGTTAPAASPDRGSPARRSRRTGISLADAERMARDAEEWDRSMGG